MDWTTWRKTGNFHFSVRPVVGLVYDVVRTFSWRTPHVRLSRPALAQDCPRAQRQQERAWRRHDGAETYKDP